MAAASRFRFPNSLQPTGSGSGKPSKIRDRNTIKQRDRAHARAQEAAARSAAARLSLLSPREHDVLRRLLEGRPNKVIAHQLGISPRTVEIHRARIMDKLECRSLAEVVRIALTGGHAPDL